MATPKAPKGGFKEGGYYEGRRYLGGQFLAPGEHQPGQQVSKEVIAQTAPENVQYIEQQRQEYSQQQQPQQPRNKEEVTPFLNNFQKNLLESTQAPETKIPTTAELKTELAPTTELPDLLDRPAQFEQLRTQYGVSDLETQLTDLKAQEDDLYAEFREQKFTEEGKPVALNVIQGRIGEEERQYLERKDYLGRQMSRVTDELNTKYALVGQLMTFSGLDYNDAVERYQVEFGNNLKIYDLVADARKEERSAYEYDRDAAKANLQVMMGAITSGNLNYASASIDQKLMITKLEAQAGFPLGTMSNLQMSPSDKILGFSSDKTQAWMMGDDGSLEIVQTGMTPTPTTSKGETEAEKKSYYTSKAQEDVSNGVTLIQMLQIYDGVLDPNEIYRIYNTNSPYGTAKEGETELAPYGIKF